MMTPAPPPDDRTNAERKRDDVSDRERDHDARRDRQREILLDKSSKEKIIDWLSKQGTSTVLLVALACLMGWRDYYQTTVSEPARLGQIQVGYEKIQADHARTQSQLLERLRDDRMRDREWATMEREKDRTEWVRIVNRHLEKEARAAKDGT